MTLSATLPPFAARISSLSFFTAPCMSASNSSMLLSLRDLPLLSTLTRASFRRARQAYASGDVMNWRQRLGFGARSRQLSQRSSSFSMRALGVPGTSRIRGRRPNHGLPKEWQNELAGVCLCRLCDCDARELTTEASTRRLSLGPSPAALPARLGRPDSGSSRGACEPRALRSDGLAAHPVGPHETPPLL